MLALALIILGLITRLIIHIPNVTPILAIALFGGVYLKKRTALWMPIILMIISDFIIGFHPTLFFTWASILLITGIGMLLKSKLSTKNSVITAIGSSVLFFVVTNFGVWISTAMYAKNLTGLVECYTLAIPFFTNTLISTLVYTVVLFGAYEFLAKRMKHLAFAEAL
ncbi:MAG: hypothetical protein ACI9E5_001227 [Candidatus Omnitrophota bacterium]|jgi:hypothetical protein